jgi:hypothetical protein
MEVPSEGTRIGQVLRVRLPEDFAVTDGPELLEAAAADEQTVGSLDVLYGYLHVRPEWACEVRDIQRVERPVHSRWLADYSVATDEMLLRYDACVRPLVMPRHAREVEETVRARAEERFAGPLAEARRRVREGEAEQSSFSFTLRDLEEVPAVANGLLTLAQITRQAIGLFGNTNAFLQNLDGQYADLDGPPGREERAMGLLKSWLEEADWASLESCGYFEVTGSRGGRYRLFRQYSFGVRELRAGGALGAAYCVVPEGAGALGDILLAQKISLETDEWGTLAVANRRAAG